MPFTGFQVKLPEYEVITPQTHLSIHYRTLSVQEEERMKGSLVTPLKVTEHLNKCLYESIAKKPEAIKNYDDFLKKLTLKDRDALLYGLYHISYEEVRNYDIYCPKCDVEYPITIQISSTFNYSKYPGKDILTKTIKKELPVSKGVSVIIKQPTLHEEIVALHSLSSRPGTTIEAITETLVIDSFLDNIDAKKGEVVYKDRVDILDAYLSLPVRDKRFINKIYNNNFGKYSVNLKMKSSCPKCGTSSLSDIDLVQQFFRMVYTS